MLRVKVDEKRVIWRHSISFEVSVYGFFICHVRNQWVCQNETSSGAFDVYFQLAFIILLRIFLKSQAGGQRWLLLFVFFK